jgi:hypothetical protein
MVDEAKKTLNAGTFQEFHFDSIRVVESGPFGIPTSYSGSPGNDLIFSQQESGGFIHGDPIGTGTGGNDVLVGSSGHDKFFGGPGDDILVSHGNIDALDGGAGNDRIYVTGVPYLSPASAHVNGEAGHDILYVAVPATGLTTEPTGVASRSGDRWKAIYDPAGNTLVTYVNIEEVVFNQAAPTVSQDGTIDLNIVSTVSIEAVDSIKTESESSFTFRVTLSPSLPGSVAVNYEVAGSSNRPADAEDFGGVFPSGSVTFAPGETEKLITIQTADDARFEGNDSFNVILTGATDGVNIGAASATGTIVNDEDPPEDLLESDGFDVFRFYNQESGAHFYTNSSAEGIMALRDLTHFRFEGASFRGIPDTDPAAEEVFRFFNTETGVHFYTIAEAERDAVIANQPQFQFEGVAYHAYEDAQPGTQELYRFFNTMTGTHFYTPSEVERDAVIANLSQFQYEGIGYYVDALMV